jgi:L-ribulose-5-phosphate 3-epimerase
MLFHLRLSNESFRPLNSFAAKFDSVARDAQRLGFEYIDLWTAHINPGWASPEHVGIVKEILARHGLTPLALSGGMGDTWQEVEKSCQLADSLGLRALAGPCHAYEVDRRSVIDVLRNFKVKLALENHPLESTAKDMRDKLDPEGVVQTTVDTGWWGTVGYDPVRAIHELADRMYCVHLKDVRGAGPHHDNCPWGEGVVPVHDCFEAVVSVGFTGPLTVEYEPDDGDPRVAIGRMREELEAWQKAVPDE